VDKNHDFYFKKSKKSDLFDLNRIFLFKSIFLNTSQIVTKRFYLLFYLKQLKWHKPRILYEYLYVHSHNIILQNNQTNFSGVIF